MRVIIIEDEKPAARMLQRKLEKLNIHTDVVLHSVGESISWFKQNTQPDLIFLDIQLSDGLSFEIFENIAVSCPVIFTTAYDEYALKAFKLNSIDYLLKPIDEQDLEAALHKYKKVVNPEALKYPNLQEIRALFDTQHKPTFKSRYSIKIGEHIKLIQVEDIEVIYSEFKGTFIHTFDGRSYLIDSPLDTLEKELNPQNFYRVSRKFIVSLKAIKDIVMYSNSRLQLTLKSFSKDEVIVSRERVSDFKEWLG